MGSEPICAYSLNVSLDSPFLHILWTLCKLCHWGWSQCTKYREM